MLTRRFRHPLPLDLRATLRPLWSGRPDRTMRLGATEAARAMRTPEGPATLLLRATGGEVEATAWGPGAAWALEQAPRLVGCDDDLDGFEPVHDLVARAHRRLAGLRIGASGLVEDVLVPTILAQKVTGLEAARAWHGICRAWGEPAPGPLGLALAPSAARLAAQPYWAYHRFGVERRRAETIIGACRRIDRLQEAVDMDRDAALRRLTALPGLGPWTAALVMRTAMGDADAVEVGDYHVKNHVAWVLAGEPRGDDARMLELLEPYTGHRGRAVRLILAGCQGAPSYGPRMPVRDIRRL